MGEIRRFLSFYVKSSQNWLKFFSCTKNVDVKKSIFLPKFQFFSHKIDIFAPTLILTETLVILPQSLHNIILSLDLEIHSFAQKLTIL